MRFDSIDIVGATGAVGRELLALLCERGVDSSSIRAFASDRSAGVHLPFGKAKLSVTALDLDAYQPAPLVLLACSAELSKRIAKQVRGQPSVVIDNSSAFRDDPAVPLVIPELLDPGARAALSKASLLASPNCSAIQLALVLAPLHRQFGIESVDVATYQAVSGAGQAALQELESQVASEAQGAPPRCEVFPHPIVGNVFPHESEVDAVTGWSVEERKLLDETRRLLGAPRLALAPSCVRVPVVRAHAQVVHVRFPEPISRDQLVGALGRAPGVTVVSRGPTPLQATGGDEVLVGRIRSLSGEPKGPSDRFALWTACDQLRKGAALNVLQIADLC